MKRSKWDAKTKTMLVLVGISGRSLSEICEVARLLMKTAKLGQIIGALTVEPTYGDELL